MTIEAQLDRIIELLEAKSSSSAGSAAASSTPTSNAPAAGEKRGRGRPPKAAPAPATEPEPEFGNDEGAADDFLSMGGEEEAPELTHDDVRKALIAYQQKPGQTQNAARKLLKTVGGVDALADLKPEKFKAVIDATTK